jgi:type I restriction enzyme M protein
MGDGTSNIINDDSLVRLVKEKKEYKVILTNPPFGDDIKVKEHKILKNFQLSSKKDNKYLATAPEILFLELCVKLLEKKGKLGIVLPEGIFGNETDLSVRKFIFDNVVVKYVISLPTETFLPRTGNKSSVLIAENNSEKINDNYEVVFIKIKKVGRNKRGETLYKYNLSGELEVDKDGNKIIDDDFLELMKKDLDIDKISLLNNFRNKPNIFKVPVKRIRENDFILIPNYYYNGTSNSKDQKEDKHHVTIRELIKGNVILTNKKGNIPRGKEIGSHSYLKSWEGDVPFIRTSDISNLEISRKPQK